MTTSEKDQLLASLRHLRSDSEDLGATLQSDLGSFRAKNGTFVHHPKNLEKETVDVATTATALMAHSLAHSPSSPQDLESMGIALQLLFNSPWESSGLPAGNYFTTSLALRAAAFMRRHDLIRSLKYNEESLVTVVANFIAKDPRRETVNEYPVTPALGYWLMDAAWRLNIIPTPDEWSTWADWATEEFHTQFALVSANAGTSMDPVAMAMAGCLASLLTKVMRKLPAPPDNRLPTKQVLDRAIEILFQHQTESGIWPHYFPLFIYPNGSAVNHCFAFELLEAILTEFPEAVEIHIDALQRAVQWCRKSRLSHEYQSHMYTGWNSGANLASSRSFKPEGWATAAVHMFLLKTQEACGESIQKLVLQRLGAKAKSPKGNKLWDTIIDSDVKLSTQNTTVKGILETIIVGWQTHGTKRKRAAVLFGPPGTSKTTLIKALAERLGFPLVSIDPSHFLSGGLERIYTQVDSIFEDLLDLRDVVVLFDEMDPLMQARAQESDIVHQSLTTVLLPKLANLYKNNGVMYFIATNHIEWFDSAITRPGRFDYHVFVGPPSWSRKSQSKATWSSFCTSDEDMVKITKLLSPPTIESAHEKMLDLFTFDEIQALLTQLKGECSSLVESLEQSGAATIRQQIKEWSEHYIILWERKDGKNEIRNEFERDKMRSRMY